MRSSKCRGNILQRGVLGSQLIKVMLYFSGFCNICSTLYILNVAIFCKLFYHSKLIFTQTKVLQLDVCLFFESESP